MNSPLNEMLRYASKLYLEVTGKVSGLIKGQIYDDLPWLTLPGKIIAVNGNKSNETARIVPCVRLSTLASLW